jgi:CDP-diacylglycerol--glycerol-3-phosphate 3-phosphatidyltransferase
VLWTLPNAISWLRIVLAAPVIVLLVRREEWALWGALVCMMFAEFSDWLDGYLARRRGQVSAVGKVLDPMADSLYRVSVFTAFAANHWMPLWMLLVIAGRDVIVSYLRLVAERSLGTMGARQSGKWKAVAQGVAQLTVVASFAVWGVNMPHAVTLGLWTVLAMATAVTAYSLVDYSVSVLRSGS